MFITVTRRKVLVGGAADLATGATPAIDIRNFRFSRFHDGSKLEFQI